MIQSDPRAAYRRVYFTAVSAAALQTRLAAASLSTWTVYLSKNGATPAVPSGGASVVEVDATNQPGVWYVQLAAADVDQIGTLTVTIRNTGGTTMEPRELAVTIGTAGDVGIATTAAAGVRRVYFVADDAAALQTRLASTSLSTWAVYLSKNGAAAAVPSGGASVVEVDATNQPGVYYLQLAAADIDTGGTLGITVRNTGGTKTMEPREIFQPIASTSALSVVTTGSAIRDRLITVITGLTPDTVVGDRFRAYRNEGGGDFRSWAEAHASGARRRFQVRSVGDRSNPAVSNTDYEERTVTYRVLVAYPQTNRDGADAALDRDDALEADILDIDHAIGMCGRANLAAPWPDACWRPEGNGEDSTIREAIIGNGVDFAELYVSYSYLRSMV